jgi:hypothetical protein
MTQMIVYMIMASPGTFLEMCQMCIQGFPDGVSTDVLLSLYLGRNGHVPHPRLVPCPYDLKFNQCKGTRTKNSRRKKKSYQSCHASVKICPKSLANIEEIKQVK